MVTKKLRELYCVDTISQDKGWKKISDAVAELNDDVIIDFSGVNVIDPWQCAEFRHLLSNPNVRMRFVNSEPMVKRIQMMCIIEGLDENRIENVVVEIPKEKTPEEKKIEHYGNELITYFDIDKENNLAVFNVRKRYDQMHSTNTLNYIDYAIRKINSEQGITKFIVELGNISTQNNVLEFFANMIVDFQLEGITLEIESNDNETVKSLGLFVHIVTNQKYDNAARFKTILSSIKNGTPGILIKYKKSKATDEFGRHGKGEVVSSRIAIFRGFKKGSKTIVKQIELPDGSFKSVEETPSLMIVETFNNNYFYTHQHWMVEHDNEVPTSLHVEKLEIAMEEIGFGDIFLGSQYHFILPIQQEKNENQMVIKDLDEDGKNIKQMCSIPERMQIVFDDWGVEYYKPALEDAIKRTKEVLDNK